MSNQTYVDAGSVAATYFQSWLAHDFDTLRSVLADDVTFDGPFAHLDNADDCVQGLRGLSKVVEDIVVRRMFVDGHDVLTWFDLHTSVADPVPTANWTHVQDGKIDAVRVAFDARGFAAA